MDIYKKTLIIGLTGGLGAGKSQVSLLLKEKGISVFDLDEIGRRILDEPKVIEKVSSLMGVSVIDNSNKLDKKKIKEIIFQEPQKRKALESLLHPWILQVFEREVAKLKNLPFVICEAALLIESGYYQKLDGLIVVSAHPDIRKRRVIERDKISEELIDKILSTQLSDQERLRYATYVIANNGDLENLKKQVENWLNHVCHGIVS